MNGAASPIQAVPDSPRQYFLTPTYLCDEDCTMCGVPRTVRLEAAHFDRARLIALVDGMGLRRQDMLVLSGGEPLLSPHFREIVAHASSRYGAKIKVLSNGRRLRLRPFAESLVGLGISRFTIPLFSDDPAVHDSIVQRPHAFEHTCAGLENLRDLGILFEVKFIALRANHQHACRTYRFVKERFPGGRFVFSGLTMFGEAVTNAADVAVQYADVAPFLEALLDEADRRNDLVPVFMFPLCHIDPDFWRHYNVARYEEVVVAPDRIDHADGRSLQEGPKPPACSGCEVRARCVFGWKRAYHTLFGDTEFRPIHSA